MLVRRTSGTADCSRAVPLAASPNAPSRRPATAGREAISREESTAGQVWRTAFPIPATTPPVPHPQSAGSVATDDLLEPAPRSSVAEQRFALRIPPAHRTSPTSRHATRIVTQYLAQLPDFFRSLLGAIPAVRGTAMDPAGSAISGHSPIQQ